ncbi:MULTISPECIES: Tat pathway signal sequence domain protein [unclassified Streptomyces]|uniref:Tat pathway signal sequence domain protein n=1 Tax=unclassified Streptomyces TaxID=2593676 RepID=UPI0036FDCB3B
MSRRAFTAAVMGGTAAVVLGGCSPGAAGSDGVDEEEALARARSFLDRRVDEAAGGARQGLPRSYTGGWMETHHSTVAFTYDVALTVIASCARGTDAGLERAGALAGTLLALQDGDPAGDGRIRQSYASGKVTAADGLPAVAAADSFTGAQAWTGLALLHVHRATGGAAYRTGALRLAEWIQDHTASATGTPGYTGGVPASGSPLTWKSTEHNIDVAAFFRALAAATGDSSWADRSAVAAGFLDALWDAEGGAFWTGTGTDGVTVNRSPVPEDPQSWSFLATGDARHAGSLDWALSRLAAEDGGFRGVSVSDADTSKVWFEGTAHMAAALRRRGGDGDGERAGRLLATLRAAQAHAPNADGYGIVAASSDGLRTGDGDTLYASLHTGTTAWFALAAQGADPFLLE